MIETLEINNFRAIAESGLLTLDPGLNVFIGPNGSGKSSLVEALRFLYEAVVTDASKALARWRGWGTVRHGATPPDEPLRIMLTFGPGTTSPSGRKAARAATQYEVEFVAAANGIDVVVQSERLTPRTTAQTPRPVPYLSVKQGKGYVRRVKPAEGRDKFDLGPGSLALRERIDRVRYKLIVPFAADVATWRFVNPVPALMRPPTPLNTDATWQETGVAVAMQLARATQIELAEISRRLAAIVTGVDKLEARLTAEGALFEVKEQVHDGLFPSWTLSDGTLRILAILAALHVGQPPAVLCIEEPENSLHPTVIDCLMSEFEAAAARGTQVIITTHSPYLLNRVKAASSKAFWVDRPQGATRFSPLPGTARLRKKMSQFGLGELLAQGALGKR